MHKLKRVSRRCQNRLQRQNTCHSTTTKFDLAVHSEEMVKSAHSCHRDTRACIDGSQVKFNDHSSAVKGDEGKIATIVPSNDTHCRWRTISRIDKGREG